MKRGTTYPITLTIEGIDLTGAEWVIVSVKPSGAALMEFTRDMMSLSSDGTDTTIAIRLSEAQSVALPTTSATIDCNWMLDGIRGGARPVSFLIDKTLLGRVVTE